MDEQRFEKQEEKTKSGKKQAGKWVLTGALGTLFTGSVAFMAVCAATGTKVVVMPQTSKDSVAASVIDSDVVKKVNQLTAYAEMYFYDEIDKEELQDGIYTGLLEGLGDRYSEYYNAEDFAEMQLDTTGKYYGIGAGLIQDKDTMVVSVSKIYEGTPSDKAGLLAGDIILSVDDVEADTMDVSELVKLIRGEEGTTVHLEIYRPSTDKYLSFDVTRENVVLPSISSEMLSDEIGYIMIEAFEESTAEQFEKAVSELETAGMESLVVDLRYNGGGLVDSVVQILDDILPEGLLVYTEDKYGERREYTSSADTYMDYPLAVLINEGSASAAEIFAGAIKDYEYGTLIGTTTYGKGIVQSIFPLQGGDAVKLTTAKYFTPSGNYIHEVGIKPDIELEYEYLNPEGTEYEMKYDNQIQKAIEVLGGE